MMNWRAKLPGPHRAVTLSQSLALRRAAQTHRGIAARLAAEGVLARGGRPFARKGVFEIPTAHAYIAGMFWRARRLYETGLYARNNDPEWRRHPCKGFPDRHPAPG